jgi:hypothetical protein
MGGARVADSELLFVPRGNSCIVIAANHLERHTVGSMRRILWRSTVVAVAVVTFSLLRLYFLGQFRGPSTVFPMYGPNPTEVLNDLTLRTPSALARVYYRAPCALNDRESCPYAIDASKRSDAAFSALQAQLQLHRIDLPDVDLSGRDLRRVPQFDPLYPWDPPATREYLHAAQARWWTGANLSGSNLTQCNLNSLELRHARFTGAKLPRADVRGADLSFADLRDADLSGGRLDDSNLTRARFDRAVLTGASLAGSILIAASGLTQAQVDSTTGDAQTILPDGLATPAHWGVRTHAR